jgi:FkbM family methyltransferase
MKELVYRNRLLRGLLYPAVMTKRVLLHSKYTCQKEIIDNLKELILGDPVIRVEEFKGVFEVDAYSDLFFRIIADKNYEPKLANLCLKYLNPNRDVLDVGANVGFYTVMFAKMVARKKVLSIEPTVNALKHLRKNIELNGVKNKVEIFEGVASNKNDVVQIKTVKGKEEYSSLGVMEHPSISGEKWIFEEVMSMTIDKLIEEKNLDPGFLKIDVEGAEHLVLEGARKLLMDQRPVILSELSDFLLRKNGSSAKAVTTLIAEYDYDIFDPCTPSGSFKIKDFGNILCFPREMKIQTL